MIDRKRFTWKVVLSSDSGATRDETFSSFWSPQYFEGASDEIARACAAEQWMLGGKKAPLIGVTAELVAA